jgi:cytochrome oxidase Cu insertion factor (SCO1/SenC/PrrC family)
MKRGTTRTYPKPPTSMAFLHMKQATIRLVTTALIIGGIVMTGLVYWLVGSPTSRSFMLVDHRGKTATEHDYLGKPMLVFFGYTSCPDVCPTTLYQLSKPTQRVGP